MACPGLRTASSARSPSPWRGLPMAVNVLPYRLYLLQKIQDVFDAAEDGPRAAMEETPARHRPAGLGHIARGAPRRASKPPGSLVWSRQRRLTRRSISGLEPYHVHSSNDGRKYIAQRSLFLHGAWPRPSEDPMSYLRFAVMIAASTVLMYGLMYQHLRAGARVLQPDTLTGWRC